MSVFMMGTNKGGIDSLTEFARAGYKGFLND